MGAQGKSDVQLVEVYSHNGKHGAQANLADLANQEEHEYTTWQAIKKNPKPFIWCMYCVWTTLLVSFENQASG
jgi:SP family general alpha glucoside:H+ symporter-like MFS transporter